MTTSNLEGLRRQARSEHGLARSNFIKGTLGGPATLRRDEIEALHQRCGIYTRPEVVSEILNAVGWSADIDLSSARLLEPSAGDGAFVVEAARRLVVSLRKRRHALTAAKLGPRIQAYELHVREAATARRRIEAALRASGLHHRTASACAKRWIITGDFLLTSQIGKTFTHTVGNPPYVRWAKLPRGLKARYERHLAKDVVGGDLFVPFLDHALELLEDGGRCGFLCSDRWRFMAFAARFRERWLPRLQIEEERKVTSAAAFVRDVGSYPNILVAIKRPLRITQAPTVVTARGRTLRETGYKIRVGPALGCTPAFVLEPDENDVEPMLLHPWIDASEIKEGEVQWRGRRVVAMHAEDGMLIDPKLYSGLDVRLKSRRKVLSERYVVRHGKPWFAPIDRVRAIDWLRPKLLVPELAKIPRCAIDRSGMIPSHGVYAIFAPDDDIDALYAKLRDGALAAQLDRLAPRVGGGYFRCYARFLAMISLGE